MIIVCASILLLLLVARPPPWAGSFQRMVFDGTIVVP